MFDSMHQTKLYTAEELYESEFREDHELDEGVLVPVMLPNLWHATICGELIRVLGNYNKQHKLGRVYAEAGFILQTNPDTVRGPDVAFVRRERLAGQPDEGFWKAHPDLAVEVVSPSDTIPQVFKKVGQYLAAGSQLVWVVHYRKRQIIVYRRDKADSILYDGNSLDGEDVLPGFRCAVSEIFAELDD